jgi:M6 family metalloprotease-like protein
VQTRVTRALAALGVLLVVAAGAPTAASARPDEPSAPIRPPSGGLVSGVGGIEFRAPSDAVLTVRQPDGSSFGARLTPAELGGHLEVDGYTVLKGGDGWWRYAAAGLRGLSPSSAVVGRSSTASGTPRGIGRMAVSEREIATDARLAASRQLDRALAQAGAQRAAAPVGGGPTVFKFPVLMLATWWDEDAGQEAPQFQDGSDTPDHFRAILDGFGGNPRGTLTEFYFENSYGQFLVQVDVFGPYTSQLSVAEGPCYYGGIDQPEDPADDLDPLDTLLGVGGVGAAGMTVEAVPQADPEVDFSEYDNNDDTYVDFMGIIHSGADMAVTGDPCHTWSHALPLSAFGDIAEGLLGLPTDTFQGGLPTTDGVLVDRVFTMPEFDEPGGSLQIGVATHEMAHALGEPDYYAVNGSSSGDGDWDIMSGGSYLGNPSGSNPSWFNPASRVFQGWVTPTIVHEDLEDYELQPRTTPIPGYTSEQPNPNLLLVPTRWVKVGEEDSAGHVWSENDVYGLVEDGDNGFVLEGWYLEYVSRMDGPHGAVHEEMTRSPYFDRGDHGSGLLTWHFDYWRRSNVYFGDNNAQDDPNRMQVDVEEWDFNDNTQEIALDLHRGESSDLVRATATGITSGTHAPNPSIPPEGEEGEPQADVAVSGGPTLPGLPTEDSFTVDDNPFSYTMRAVVGGQGDCIVQLFRIEDGERVQESDTVDSAGAGEPEEIIITQPEAGEWVVEVSDFAACGTWEGTISFEPPSGYDAKGTADTWSNETGEPTGWAFTNVRSPGASSGLDLGSESGFENSITLDVLQLADDVDVSAGYVRPAVNDATGRGVVTAGAENPMSVAVHSNGGEAPGNVSVTVREGGPSGPVVFNDVVEMGAYERRELEFSYTPDAEGPFTLHTTVSAAGDGVANDGQASVGWAGPTAPSVLVVDDEGYTDGEEAYTGALAALGVPYAVATGHVTAAAMAAYDAVIWVAAIDRGHGQLDGDDRDAISAYLDGGGRMWLASNRAIGAIEIDEEVEETSEFAVGYFGADAEETTTLEKVHTVAGAGAVFPEDLSFELQPYPIRPFSDILAVVEEGVFGTAELALELTEANKPGRDGKGFGTRVEGDAEHGSFRTVLTPFSLSQASSADTWISVTRAVLEDFEVDFDQYAPASDDPLVFHPTVRFQVSGLDTPVTAVVLGGTSGQPVTLTYRVHGEGPFTSVSMAPGEEDGAYGAVIPGSAVTPSGLDYFVKAGSASTYDPTAAESGQLTHAIAVAIPEVEPVTPPAPPAPPPPPPAPPAPSGGQRLPATGGAVLTGVAVVLLLGGLGARRLVRSG